MRTAKTVGVVPSDYPELGRLPPGQQYEVASHRPIDCAHEAVHERNQRELAWILKLRFGVLNRVVAGGPFKEKRRIVEEAMVPGASVAQVARLHGVNANQVFAWRRQYQAGELVPAGTSGPKLLPVIVADSAEQEANEDADARGGSIHIEFPGRAPVSIEAGVDPALAAAVIERLAR